MQPQPKYEQTFKRHSEMKRMKHENESEAHQLFRSVPGHEPRGSSNSSNKQTSDSQGRQPPGIISPGSTGVIYVTDRAAANGFKGNSARLLLLLVAVKAPDAHRQRIRTGPTSVKELQRWGTSKE